MNREIGWFMHFRMIIEVSIIVEIFDMQHRPAKPCRCEASVENTSNNEKEQGVVADVKIQTRNKEVERKICTGFQRQVYGRSCVGAGLTQEAFPTPLDHFIVCF